jgi:hypothetical protein
MALQYSDTLRNNQLDAIETTLGTSAVLKIRSGAAPANVAAADTGTVLATLNLPADWMAAAAAGAKAKSGTWEDLVADATGTAGHFRIYTSGGTVPHMQGSVGTSASDMIVDSTSFTAGQAFTVTAFSIAAGNA